MTHEILYQKYVVEKKSWAVIAKELNTYPNLLRRLAKKFGIESRSKSEAQSLALTNREHPTRGKKRSQSSRDKTSEGVRKAWSRISKEERKNRADKARERFDKRTDKQEFWNKAGRKIRESARHGSEMERVIISHLTALGHKPIWHGKTETNANLEVDILVPGCGVAIEVDGPSHFTPIWGQESLRMTQVKDAEKNGLLLQSYRVFRLRYNRVTEGIKRRACKAVEDFINGKIKFSEREIT